MGLPKYNIKLEKYKPVRVMFDVVVPHINNSVGNGDYLWHDKVESDADGIHKQELLCVFWDSRISNWSSDGCITLFPDGFLQRDILPKGRIFLHITLLNNNNNEIVYFCFVIMIHSMFSKIEIGNTNRNVSVKCECNHLTNFAVIVTLRKGRGINRLFVN